jgi:hypothetical protein
MIIIGEFEMRENGEYVTCHYFWRAFRQMSSKLYSEMRYSISLQKYSVGKNQLLQFQQAFVGRICRSELVVIVVVSAAVSGSWEWWGSTTAFRDSWFCTSATLAYLGLRSRALNWYAKHIETWRGQHELVVYGLVLNGSEIIAVRAFQRYISVSGNSGFLILHVSCTDCSQSDGICLLKIMESAFVAATRTGTLRMGVD